ncbi:hypothetical protein ONZ45_g15213 [Pleurotus djamor]|nr:hypothetical protein ONZ45_g15213 [Pleurotus djamor]
MSRHSADSTEAQKREVEHLHRIIEAKDKTIQLLRARLSRSEAKAQLLSKATQSDMLDTKLSATEDKMLKYYEETTQKIQAAIQGLQGTTQLRIPSNVILQQGDEEASEGSEESDINHTGATIIHGVRQLVQENELFRQQLSEERDSNLARLLSTERQFEDLLAAAQELGDFEGLMDKAIREHRHDLEAKISIEEGKATQLSQELEDVRATAAPDPVGISFPSQEGEDIKPVKTEDDEAGTTLDNCSAEEWKRKYLGNLMVAYRDLLSIVRLLEETVKLPGETPSAPLTNALTMAKGYLSQLESEVVDDKIRQTLVALKGN